MGFILLRVGIALYFLPTMVAVERKKRTGERWEESAGTSLKGTTEETKLTL